VLQKTAAKEEAETPSSDSVQALYPAASAGSEHFWVVDAQEGFVVGSEKGSGSTQDATCMVEVQLPQGGKEEREIPRAKIGPKIQAMDDLLHGCADMVEMSEINEATILHNLRLRHAKDVIYTNIGSILISVNPFKFTNSIYTQDQVVVYAKAAKTGAKVAPHIFALAEAAFRGIRDDYQDQSILISGESGAGKTEATKKCLQYFVEVASEQTTASGGGASVADKILSANPVLESFGNAQTVRNHNSSRFGKWMQILFDNRGFMANCQIINYMLETSRAVLQPVGEKNFHVFYQLVASVTPEQRKALHLEGRQITTGGEGGGEAGAFQYLRLAAPKSTAEAEQQELQEDYAELVVQLQQLGFSEAEVLGIHELLAAILHLGECVFEARPANAEDTSSGRAAGCKLVEEGPAKDNNAHAADLWGSTVEKLELALCNKLLRIGTDDTLVPLTVVEAQGLRDALAMNAYDRLFNFVVEKVNRSLTEQVGGGLADDSGEIAPLVLPKSPVAKKKGGKKMRVIGVLDIFGFECFDHNCFEQLCINYCNEKLQQHFIHHTVMEELNKYEEHAHCTRHTILTILYSLYCPRYIVLTLLYSLYCTRYTVPTILYSLYSTPYTTLTLPGTRSRGLTSSTPSPSPITRPVWRCWSRARPAYSACWITSGSWARTALSTRS
jgi:myosin heavy subunit